MIAKRRLGLQSEDGNIYLEGRLKRIIIRHDGIKVSPFSLGKVIMKHPNVSACYVVGKFDSIHKMGQVLVAYIVLKEQNTVFLEEINSRCEQDLGTRYLPDKYEIIHAFPLTSNGKVDYRALEKEVEK